MLITLRRVIATHLHIAGYGICLFCRQPTTQPLLCHYCAEELPLLDHHCRLCGTPLAGDNDICGHCLLEPPEWDFLHILADFEFPLTGPPAEISTQTITCRPIRPYAGRTLSCRGTQTRSDPTGSVTLATSMVPRLQSGTGDRTPYHAATEYSLQ